MLHYNILQFLSCNAYQINIRFYELTIFLNINDLL
jgi:hypothetical protein